MTVRYADTHTPHTLALFYNLVYSNLGPPHNFLEVNLSPNIAPYPPVSSNKTG